MTPDDRPSLLARYGAPVSVAVLALLLYVRTMLPGLAFDDWGEMQTVPHVLGVAHPTGYPTYVLVAWAFELLPIGDVAFRANLLSAVCIALALAFATSAQQRLGVAPVIAAVASLATGARRARSGSSAVVAEVNPLHLLFMALLIDRSLAWADGRRLRDLALGGLLIGLSLGNHALTLFVAPYLILYVLWAGRSTLLEHKAWILAPVATVFAGAAVYLYIPIAAVAASAAALQQPRDLGGVPVPRHGRAVPRPVRRPPHRRWARVVPRVAAGPLDAPGRERDGRPADPGRCWAASRWLRRRPAFAAALVAIVLTGLYVWANYLRAGALPAGAVARHRASSRASRSTPGPAWSRVPCRSAGARDPSAGAAVLGVGARRGADRRPTSRRWTAAATGRPTTTSTRCSRRCRRTRRS